jgi:hypothetical protein
MDREQKIFCMVVGVWDLPTSIGGGRLSRFNVDPRMDDGWSVGYLLLPSGQSGFIYAWYGDVDEEDGRLVLA